MKDIPISFTKCLANALFYTENVTNVSSFILNPHIYNTALIFDSVKPCHNF